MVDNDNDRTSLQLALGNILLLWVIYTIVYTLHPGDLLAVFLEFIPAILAVGTLWAAGFQRRDCYLRMGRISKAGVALLAASLLFIPFILLTGRWTGWNWVAAFIYAPASGISQELFFRAALLSVLLARYKMLPNVAIMLQAIFFSLWHVPKAWAVAPMLGVIGVAVVTFVCGILWGMQVRRDRTVIWIMGFHSLLLMINSLFTWG